MEKTNLAIFADASASVLLSRQLQHSLATGQVWQGQACRSSWPFCCAEP